MNLDPRFDPKLPKDVTERQLISTYLIKRELPYIEMTMAKDGVVARVVFNFKHKRYSKIFQKIFLGPQEDIYKLCARQASRIGLNLERQFNSEWNKTLVQLLNKPSKDKTILNIGTYKNNTYGIYDIENPSVLLNQKIIESGMSLKQVAQLADVNETTLFRHLKGTFEISRDVAIKYAKALGCDPAQILFNNLNIPVWGSTDTMEMAMVERLSVYASEITANNKLGTVECPREIYRPDVKAIRIDSPNSSLHSQVAFYYHTNEPIVFEDQIVVVGTRLKNLSNSEIRTRYFIGVYKKNKNGKTVDLHTIDPNAVDVSGYEPDEDFHSFDDVVGLAEDQKIVIEDIIPTFVAPVVALIDQSKVYDPIKTEILKAYDEIYTQNRTQELLETKEAKILQMKSAVEKKTEEIISDDVDDHLQDLEQKKLKALIDADKALLSVVGKAAYENAKLEKKLSDKVKQIKAQLTAEEEKAIQAVYDRIKDISETPGPNDEEFQNS